MSDTYLDRLNEEVEELEFRLNKLSLFLGSSTKPLLAH